jgi:hypothetical protein
MRTASITRAPLKRRSTPTRLHGATSQKGVIFILVDVRTWTLHPSNRWRYSQNPTLASSIFCLNNFLSLATSFQLRQRRKLAASCSTASCNLFLGFPTDLTPSNLPLNTFLGIRVPSIFWACPAHWSLLSLIHVTRSGSQYSSYNSLLYLILHWPLSWTGPQILLNNLNSHIL